MVQSTGAFAERSAEAGEPTPQLLAALGNERMRALGQIVGLLTRSAHHQTMTIADIKRGLIAPIMLGQYILAGRSNEGGAGSPPVAALIWARVSEAVDQRLTAAQSARIELAPDEWNTGDIVWLTEATGDLRLVPQMVVRLRATDPTIRAIRVASPAGDGKIAVRTLDPQ
jgi:hemolysin-activating ACP:hemolysin acyltransferase